MSELHDNAMHILRQEINAVSYELRRPSVLLRPRIFPDGDQWCALLGENLMEGVAGFGATPELAASAFDDAWNSARPPKQAPTAGELTKLVKDAAQANDTRLRDALDGWDMERRLVEKLKDAAEHLIIMWDKTSALSPTVEDAVEQLRVVLEKETGSGAPDAVGNRPSSDGLATARQLLDDLRTLVRDAFPTTDAALARLNAIEKALADQPQEATDDEQGQDPEQPR